MTDTNSNLCIVFPSGFGGVCFTIPAQGMDINQIALDILPDAIPRKIIPTSSLPDQEFRDAWEFNLELGALVNLEKAKNIHKDRIRTARSEVFKKTDVDFMIALKNNDEQKKLEVIELTNILKDLTDHVDILNATDLASLKACWWTELLGPTPYSTAN